MFRHFTIVLLFTAIVAGPALAASDRVALVLGLSDYRTITPLDNPRKDATGMARVLDRIGFDVTLALDPTGDDMRQLLDDFAFRSETADLALIYYAGHGVEVQGENFMIPVDADVKSNRDVQRQSVSLKQMLTAVERARKMRIVILDSCRDNPLGDLLDTVDTGASSSAPGDSRGGGGLAVANPDRGTLVAYAARDGQVALDGTGENSPYATALMEKMAQPGVEISLMFRQVRDMVLRETGNRQEPHTYGSLTGVPFYLAGAAEGQQDVADASTLDAWSSIRPDQEEQLLALAELGDTRSMLGLAYMRLNPNQGRFDPVEAVSFLERAAAAGSPEAQFELAKLYERGTGVPVNEARALELYRAAANQDFADAINDLGFLTYQGGLGLDPNPQEALRLFERAADLRHPQAQFNFAALIDDGHIESKGPKDSAHYLYEALRSGSPDVLNILSDRPTMFTRQTRRALQTTLRDNGFYAGGIDGEFGPGTRKAIRLAFGLEE
ncbi:caspase family protein [Pukyongiella litopenaei]|uniref:Peptidase C14, caspase catalytic subunit p20 n=1 Tax=Pukyongiella litopenaei TaxID=2605946 RepID=A0A2S0MP50_9RHOB|nr:caspase family protein [Pukyongiella litopenaei]AVO37672.1 peptidase C14, caspase catalytic subunit p20 [Pukyongiella litopenaei]